MDILYYDNKTFTDDEFSLYLIEKYLNMYFEDTSVMKDRFTPKQISRLLGEIDISFFASYYMRNKFIVSDINTSRELAPAHYEMWNVLNDTFVNDLMDKINLVEPRGKAMPPYYRNIICKIG